MKLKITNVSALQSFQLIRFGAFLLIGIVFTKTSLTTAEIGEYEQFLFLAGGISFFWLNGLIRGILPLSGNESERQSRFFNSFLLLTFFTTISIGVLAFAARPLSVAVLNSDHISYLGLLLLYLFFSVPASLVEYFFLLRNEPRKIFGYGAISFFVMIVLVILPSIFEKGIGYCLWGLVISAGLRYLYLWYLLIRSGSWRWSAAFMKEHLSLSFPLILSALLSGSAQYVDGFIVTSRFDQATFAVFRYGARELPFVLLLANAFSNAMLPVFGSEGNVSSALEKIKSESTRLANYLFPLSAVLLLSSHILFPIVFNAQFSQSASIFNIYLLLITSRLLFPQTILIGLKQTPLIAWASLWELVLNVAFSLWFVHLWGIEGVAYATVLAYLFEKSFLSMMVEARLNIPVTKYQNISRHLLYSLLLFILFFVIEFLIY